LKFKKITILEDFLIYYFLKETKRGRSWWRGERITHR